MHRSGGGHRISETNVTRNQRDQDDQDIFDVFEKVVRHETTIEQKVPRNVVAFAFCSTCLTSVALAGITSSAGWPRGHSARSKRWNEFGVPRSWSPRQGRGFRHT